MDTVNITIFDIVTLILAIKTILISLFLIRILRTNRRFLAKGCGIHIEAILYFTFFSGLTSLPSLGYLFYYGNINCPEVALAFLSLPRIFTLRFEIMQFTCLGIDRVVSTLLTNGYQRKIRNWSFGISAGISFIFALTDVTIYIVRDRFRQYAPQCGLGNGGSSNFAGYFFLINFLCFSLILSCFIFHAYESINHPNTGSVTLRFLSQQINNLFFIFLCGFGAPTIILTIYRLFHFEALKNIINHTDFAMQLLHVILILSFLFCLNSKRKHLKQVSTTTSTFVSVPPLPKHSVPIQMELQQKLDELPGSTGKV